MPGASADTGAAKAKPMPEPTPKSESLSELEKEYKRLRALSEPNRKPAPEMYRDEVEKDVFVTYWGRKPTEEEKKDKELMRLWRIMEDRLKDVKELYVQTGYKKRRKPSRERVKYTVDSFNEINSKIEEMTGKKNIIVGINEPSEIKKKRLRAERAYEKATKPYNMYTKEEYDILGKIGDERIKNSNLPLFIE